MADRTEAEPRLSVSQNPGNFFIFWNIVVPLTVLINIRRFGLRLHELGLAIALLLNPFLLNRLVHYRVLTFLVVMFLIIWIERVLRRWAWYKIYSWSFFRSLLLLAIFIALPSLVLTFVWRPLQVVLPEVLLNMNPDWTSEEASRYRDVVMLVVAMGLLLHSIYFYSQCDHCIGEVTGRRMREIFFPKCKKKSHRSCKCCK